MQLSFPARAPAITVTSPNASKIGDLDLIGRAASSPSRQRRATRFGAAPFQHEPRTARSEGQETAQPAGSAGEPVTRSQMELEIEFNRHGATPGLERYHLHTKCFAAWELERKKSSAD